MCAVLNCSHAAADRNGKQLEISAAVQGGELLNEMFPDNRHAGVGRIARSS
jgi:hypothetical protein